MRPTILPLLALLPIPLQGCCSMARFFCGPDPTPWISRSFDTPQHAAQTLFEAIRRDDPEVIYLCLAESYRHELGLDGLTAQVFWARLREKNPGLHVAGFATVPTPTLLTPDRATVAVDVEGRTIEIDLERQAYWEVRFQRRDGAVVEQGGTLVSFAGRAQIDPIEDPNEDRSRLTLMPLTLYHDNEATPDLESIAHAALTRRWKVADLRMRQSP